MKESEVSTTERKARPGNGRVRGPLLTAKQAVEYLGISLSTLHRIEQKGLLSPFRTPGGHRRYDISMLEEYLERTRHAFQHTSFFEDIEP